MGMYNDPEYFEKRAYFRRRKFKKIIELICTIIHHGK